MQLYGNLLETSMVTLLLLIQFNKKYSIAGTKPTTIKYSIKLKQTVKSSTTRLYVTSLFPCSHSVQSIRVNRNKTAQSDNLPPTKEEVYVFAHTPAFVCLFVCLCARLLKNAFMDLDEMLRVDRCWDMDELINF